ncbi:hypothetical protein JEQ12_010800 [Ovis aries]|uniref:Adenosine 3'-phospho 5'-phosphosulfate transporter 2 n=1 Tax=Ovis aries TaxID=9940 RepID=A0A835ZPH2_SHEEP|nr:hypothetical protein JEQ12_010800 [Ovis aries]
MRAPGEEAAAAAAAEVASAGVGEEETQEDLAQQAEGGLSKGEETNKDNFGSTECGKIGTMDLKFNSSRKYISITVPSKTQAMSPHIKSIDDIVVLGINLSRFNRLTQFFICVAGVFVFYLIYGYLQELIFSVEGFKPYGWYLTLVQFAFYSIFGLIELQLIQDKRRRIPGKTYMIIAFLTVGTMGLSNTSLGFLNYPTQVIFKCCKLIPVMLGGVFIQGKRYNVADVSAALCMSLGLIWFTLADSTVAPNFNLTGVVLISLALCADAVIGNVQEKVMKLHNASNSEMVLYSYSIGFVYILLGLTCTSGLGPAVTFCAKDPIRTYGYAFLFSLTGYFGISFVLALIKIFGALLAVTADNHTATLAGVQEAFLDEGPSDQGPWTDPFQNLLHFSSFPPKSEVVTSFEKNTDQAFTERDTHVPRDVSEEGTSKRKQDVTQPNPGHPRNPACPGVPGKPPLPTSDLHLTEFKVTPDPRKDKEEWMDAGRPLSHTNGILIGILVS